MPFYANPHQAKTATPMAPWFPCRHGVDQARLRGNSYSLAWGCAR